MDWAGIEAVVYSEADSPQEVLGPRVVEDGVLVGGFMPEAQGMTVVTGNGKEYPMVNEDHDIAVRDKGSVRLGSLFRLWHIALKNMLDQK